MKNIIIALALLIGLASCTKYEDNTNSTTDVRSLPALHAVILGTTYDFPAPTDYQMWDATTDCHYYQGDLKLDVTVFLDGRVWSLPHGTLKGFTFSIVPPEGASGGIIMFTSGDFYPIEWVMVP